MENRNTEDQKIYEQCKGSLIATAVFDALGLPVETLDEATIARDFPTVEQKYLRCPPSHPAYTEHVAGHWSDDTQLSLAVQRAIIENGGDINMRTIARKQVEAAAESVMGWGGATRESTDRLAKTDFDFTHSGKDGAVGNGVVMKMVPLVLAMHKHPDFQSEQKWLETIQDFTYITHRSVVALVCSAVHAKMNKEVLVSDPINIKTAEGRRLFLSRSLECAKRFETEFGETQKLLSQRFQGLLEHFDDLKSNGTLLAQSNGGTCFVPDTLTMCYGLLATDFRFDSAHRAIMIGGDTDSNASIVGSMVALVEPVAHIAQHLRDGVWRKEELIKISGEFADVLNKK